MSEQKGIFAVARRWRADGHYRSVNLMIGGTIALLHAGGLTLFLVYSAGQPALSGLGALAYGLGVRHAFDADHIAAVDNTTRKFVQEGRPTAGVGFFFAMGHSTVVIALTAAVTLAATAVASSLPQISDYGSYIGTTVSVSFLWIIGILNLIVLLDILRIYRETRAGRADGHLEESLLRRGLMSRVVVRRMFGFLKRPVQMFPVGVLFGLGFDTASEVSLLALAAGTADEVPFLAVMSLPMLFAAGMSSMATINGTVIRKVYTWSIASPLRNARYNIAVTLLSILVAFGIGGTVLLQAVGDKLRIDTGPWAWISAVDFEKLGYATVVVFIAAWAAAAVCWRSPSAREPAMTEWVRR